MKPLSERDENQPHPPHQYNQLYVVGMKPLSERDENIVCAIAVQFFFVTCRNEATL